jgi:hypothetical protein
MKREVEMLLSWLNDIAMSTIVVVGQLQVLNM